MKKFLTIFIILISCTVQARWINLDEASAEIIFENNDIKIDKTGKSEENIETRIKILNEAGRDNYASYWITYNGDISKVKILEAYTIYKGEKYNISPESIEDKPLASSAQGFDQMRQVLLSFPKAEIGAEIYLKYTRQNTKTALANFYSNVIGFSTNGCIQTSHQTISSQLPLYIDVNNPDKVLKITEDKKDDIYNLDIQLAKPVCLDVAGGSEVGSINGAKYPYVAVSSLNNWQEYAKQSSVDYNRVINQPLPEIFLPILEAAKAEKDEIAQMNIVTSMINEKIRYMGGWLSIEGHLFPRDLAVIAKLQEADCKEFSSLTANILRQLGFKAQAVWVDRGNQFSSEEPLPLLNIFNHAILKVTNKAGKVYWIDPTNLVSMAQGVFPDIADKMVLVLDGDNSKYERNANIDPNHSQINFIDEIEVKNNKTTHSGEVSLNGESAFILAGEGLYQSENAIKDQVFHMLSNKHLNEEEKKELILPDLTSRIVKDLKIKFQYKQSDELIKTNLQPAFAIESNWVSKFINYVPNQLSDIYIGPVRTDKNKTIFKDIKIKTIDNLNYTIDTPWMSINRSFKYNDNNSEMDIVIVIKKRFITSEELKSPEYIALKNSLEENVKNIAVILDIKS